ncbi:PRTRC genetic system protein E [Mesoflavibacter sabulilitoris]|uniref:ParB-related ThiF-related cassette protein E domain-containing protein n=1 Tax=Mesoflavibacter zeaxanthinifaciens subsp. sabulilitoris TaxID=1520893 RepID=A0A2T1NNM2_9FLAO|nr:hypothetical protein [Mesoflavibacter zeaxanthinifaciens]MBB3125264.1 PRTRC genetic system protein E [Mesoflavibacter zeaxanthinifaciens subsp. sabulilitoris]PSG94499.1 hypothetical protein C7H61_00770 [Mesoflavibacter zeaxanthinifaciens subsp. sabulilitoris]
MKTNFFSELARLGISNCNMSFLLHKDNSMTVSLKVNHSAEDNALNVIPPLTFTYPINELDDGFFDAINQPIKNSVSLNDNIEAFEIATKEAQEKSKIAKAEKEKKDKIAKKAKDTFDKVKELIASEEFNFNDAKAVTKALNDLQSIKSTYPNSQEVILLINDIKSKQSQVDLFASDSNTLDAFNLDNQNS